MEAHPPPGQATVIDLATAVRSEPDGIISRTIWKDEHLKAVVFGFGAGQELSEHTASKPAIMHFLTGEADVTVGSQRHSATPGTWIHMPAGMPHAIVALQPTTMLLLLLE